MNRKNQRPNLRSVTDRSASLLLWVISGLYLLTMVLAFAAVSDGRIRPQEAQPWLVPAVVVFTVSYGILSLLLWPHEKASFEGRPERIPLRTIRRTIAFRRPFYLKGVDRLLPPADYRVVTDEELIDGLSFSAYRRVSTATVVLVESGCAVEMVIIDPLDLQAAIDRDARERIDDSAPVPSPE